MKTLAQFILAAWAALAAGVLASILIGLLS